MQKHIQGHFFQIEAYPLPKLKKKNLKILLKFSTKPPKKIKQTLQVLLCQQKTKPNQTNTKASFGLKLELESELDGNKGGLKMKMTFF